jgi:hypothetical protein
LESFNLGLCQTRDEDRVWITDSAAWSGGPDPFWFSQGMFHPMQADDGSWRMQDPVHDSLWGSGLVAREFHGVRTAEFYDCNTMTFSREELMLSAPNFRDSSDLYGAVFRQPDHVKPLAGDRDGLLFTRHESWIVDQGNPEIPVVDVTYDVTVRRVPCGAGAAGAGQACQAPCQSHTSPIDAKDPAITNLEIAIESYKPSIPPNNGFTDEPPKPATLTVRVTCDGVPVKNADLY